MVSVFYNKKDEFEKFFKTGRVLGKGSFAEVKVCRSRSSGDSTKYAVKIINKSSMRSTDTEMLGNEVEIMKSIRHRNVLSLIQCFDCDNKFYMVLELCQGGELFDRIVKKSFYSENEARSCMAQLCAALEHCHANGIVHRDIKPENLLYMNKEPDETIKLADFGLAALIGPDEALNTACGTPGYVAPELIKREPYGTMVDMWSAGVVLHILLCGFPPFYDDHKPTLFKMIVKGKFQFVTPYWDQVTDEAKNLVSSLLVVDPAQRLTAAQTLAHPWMTRQESLGDNVLEGFTENMRAYNLKRKFKGAIQAMQVVNDLTRRTALHAPRRTAEDTAAAAEQSAGAAGAVAEVAAAAKPVEAGAPVVAAPAAAAPAEAAAVPSPPAPTPAVGEQVQ